MRIAKEQLQYFEDREKLPNDDELKNVLLVDFTEDIGFTLDSIDYGYINEFEPKPVSGYRNIYTLDEEPYFSKSHRSSSKPKIVISFSQKNLQDVTEEQVENEFEISLKKIELQGYNVDSELYFTRSRYYNGEWRPESFLIIIQSNE